MSPTRDKCVRIFFSHNSRQKLFVKAIQQEISLDWSSIIEIWLDEKDIHSGQFLSTEIQRSIQDICSFFVIVVDNKAAESEWVAKEIEWALEQEKKIQRTFLIPIVLEKEAWDSFHFCGVGERKYIYCKDFEDVSIKSTARSLIREIFYYISMAFLHLPHQSEIKSDSDIVEQADDLLRSSSSLIRSIVHPYREHDPLRISELTKLLSKESNALTMKLLENLNSHGMSDGIYFDDDFIFLAIERYSNKHDLNKALKDRIGKRAASYIRSNQSIAVDGGSTTLSMTEALIRKMKSGIISNITIYTNSIIIAERLLSTLSKMSNPDQICKVTIIGGWYRPTSLPAIPTIEDDESLDVFAHLPKELDLSFLGTNGLFGREAFGMTHSYEVPVKKEFISRAKKKIVLCDPSKFRIQQDVPFAWYKEELVVLTVHSDEYDSEIERVRTDIENSGSELILC